MTNDKSQTIVLISLYFLSISSGYLSGRLITNDQLPITFQKDQRTPIPTIQINGVRNGLLHGKIVGSARLSIGDTVLTQSGVFALDAGSLLKNQIDIVVPDGMQFVASSRGKKYSPVFSAGGERIIPGNRVYFRNAEEAEISGYVP